MVKQLNLANQTWLDKRKTTILRGLESLTRDEKGIILSVSPTDINMWSCLHNWFSTHEGVKNDIMRCL